MRIDAHQHFWRYRPETHGWITDAMAVLKRDFLPEDLGPLLRAQGLDGCVAVQAAQSLDETRFLLALADAHPFVKAVVGWVDLLSPDLERELDAFAAHRRFRGVRHVAQDEPDDSGSPGRGSSAASERSGGSTSPTTSSFTPASCRPPSRWRGRCPISRSWWTTSPSPRSGRGASSRGGATSGGWPRSPTSTASSPGS